MPAVCSCRTSVRPRGLRLDNPSFVSYHLLQCRRRHARQQRSGARQCSRPRWSRSRRAGCTGRRRRTSRAPPASRSRTSSACSGRRRSSSSRRSSAAWPTRWSSSARPRATVAGRRRSRRWARPTSRWSRATVRDFSPSCRRTRRATTPRSARRSARASARCISSSRPSRGSARSAWRSGSRRGCSSTSSRQWTCGGRASRGRAACSRGRSIPRRTRRRPGAELSLFICPAK